MSGCLAGTGCRFQTKRGISWVPDAACQPTNVFNQLLIGLSLRQVYFYCLKTNYITIYLGN